MSLRFAMRAAMQTMRFVLPAALRFALTGCALLGALAKTAGAQTTGATVTGIAFDSLNFRPLPGAFISIEGQSRSAIAGANGAFTFNGLTPGRYLFAMQHETLDSLGLSGVTARVNVSAAGATVTLAVPSFNTLWRTVCGTANAPVDTGFVYGSVRDARTGAPLADVSVDVSWIELSKIDRGGSTQVNQRRWRNIGRSDSTGDYAVCGLPTDAVIRIRGVSDSSATDVIDLPNTGARVRRRDLLLATAADTTHRGAVGGFVTDPRGRPQYNVRVAVEGVPEARTTSDGRFTLRDVPAGTRQVEFTAIGMLPVSTVVDVRANDTVRVAVSLRNVTTLDVVKVTGDAHQQRFARGIEERKRSGFGYQMDSTKISQNATLASVFAGMPSMRVQRRGNTTLFNLLLPGNAVRGPCEAYIFLDGVPRNGQDDLDFLRASDIATIEVYPRVYSVPVELAPPRDNECGVVAVWTKAAFR
jgi:hypothetical protein